MRQLVGEVRVRSHEMERDAAGGIIGHDPARQVADVDRFLVLRRAVVCAYDGAKQVRTPRIAQCVHEEAAFERTSEVGCPNWDPCRVFEPGTQLERVCST